MISENELAKLSFPGAPKMVTKEVPGPKTKAILDDEPKYEAMTRGAGRFPMVYDEGFGVGVKDPDGNLYIDLSAGVAVNAVGRRHPRVMAAMQEQAGKLMHAVEMANTKRAELAKKISTIMPEGLRGNAVSTFAQSGSGAVDTAIKFARHFTGRDQIVAFHGAYHGVWAGSGALTTGKRYHYGFGPLMPYVIHMPYAYCYRCCFGLEYPKCGLQCAKYVDYVMNTPYTACDDVAALIVEPQQGEGGYVIPPPGYMEMLKQACDKHGALFIADEVQAGSGRSGKLWSIEYSKVVPDMLTWGKGMGGDLPMAGCTFRGDLADKLVEGSLPGTFAANATSCVVCMTNIDIITDKEANLMGRAYQLGEEVKAKVQDAAKHIRLIGDVRGRGLMIGIELVNDRETKEPLDKEMMDRVIIGVVSSGVIAVPCGRYGTVLRLMPSLTITREYLNKGTDIILDVIEKVSKGK